MATFTAVLDNSRTDVEGHSKFLNRLMSPGVAMVVSPNSLLAVQRAAGANMSVDISTGDAHLELPSKAYSFWSWTDSATNVPISAANPTNPRVDSVVAWVDPSVTTTGSNNSPGSLKFSVIAGTASATPQAVSDVAIQAALGASIAWIRIAYVYVGASTTSIINATITDARVQAQVRAQVNSTSLINPHKFSSTLVTPQSFPAATPTTILFATSQYSTGSNYSSTTGRFTATVAGYYHFNAAVSFTPASSTTAYISLFKNGTEYRRGNRIDSVSGAIGVSVSCSVYLAANDYVDARGYIGIGGTAENSPVTNFFDGFLISKD